MDAWGGKLVCRAQHAARGAHPHDLRHSVQAEAVLLPLRSRQELLRNARMSLGGGDRHAAGEKIADVRRELRAEAAVQHGLKDVLHGLLRGPRHVEHGEMARHARAHACTAPAGRPTRAGKEHAVQVLPLRGAWIVPASSVLQGTTAIRTVTCDRSVSLSASRVHNTASG